MSGTSEIYSVKVSGDKTVAKVLYALEDKICNG